MIPSVTFLFGCWIGCMVGLFLAGALAAARVDDAELEPSSFPVRGGQVTLAMAEEHKGRL